MTLELKALDFYKHISSGRLFQYICRDYEDHKQICLYDTEKQIAVLVPEDRFLRNYYNVSPEVHNDD